jgi:hypothetical protein
MYPVRFGNIHFGSNGYVCFESVSSSLALTIAKDIRVTLQWWTSESCLNSRMIFVMSLLHDHMPVISSDKFKTRRTSWSKKYRFQGCFGTMWAG